MNSIPWTRLVAEAAVIVGSILLAFAVDAAWSGRLERQLIADQRRQLYTQMQANSELLAISSTRSANSLHAMQTLVTLIGPTPETVSQDSIATLINRGFGGGLGHLHVNSVEALLSSPGFLLGTDQKLHDQLITFESISQQLVRYDALFVDTRTEFRTLLTASVPMAFASGGRGVHEGTDFEVPIDELLTDPQIESMAAALANRSAFMGRGVEEMRVVVDSIISLLEPGAA